jgi:toxin-antitoxin system PIN domain toxin
LNAPGSLFDTSVWIALSFAAHPLHPPARAAFLAASPANRAFFCRATQQSVLRILSTPAIVKAYGVPTPTNRDALAILDRLMAYPSVGFVEEPPNIVPRWRAFADLPSPSPKRWMDAYLAAFAFEAGLTLVTGDADFKAFPGLNPTVLIAPPPPAVQGPGTQP